MSVEARPYDSVQDKESSDWLLLGANILPALNDT